MAKQTHATDGRTTTMRWTARILALVVMALFTWFAIDLGPKVFPELGWGAQGLPLLLGIAVAIVGLIVAWQWELVGGAMAVLGAVVTMALVCAGSGVDMLLCAFLFSLPILVAGALYLGCCYRTRTLESAQ